MHYHTPKTKENKICTKDKIAPQHIHYLAGARQTLRHQPSGGQNSRNEPAQHIHYLAGARQTLRHQPSGGQNSRNEPAQTKLYSGVLKDTMIKKQ